MKSVDEKSSTHTDFGIDKNHKNPKFHIGNHVRISKYKNIFVKGYIPNWSEKVFVIKKVKNTVPWTYIMEEINEEEIAVTFYEKIAKKNQSLQLKK